MELDAIQLAVASHHKGPVIANAGPGSGKTSTVIQRTLKMLESGINTDDILIITFTREAAKEIRKRLDAAYPNNNIWVSTIHSLGYSILTDLTDGNLPKLLDEEAGYSRYVDIAHPRGYGIDREHYLSITNAKSLMTKPGSHYASPQYDDYLEELTKANEMDQQDLIFLPYLMMKNNRKLRKRWNQRWKYVTVDEAHDCTPLEANFISMIAGKNLFLILDENQSIYVWRQGNASFVSKIRWNFKRYQLPYTYRCPTFIYNKAWNLIRNYTDQEVLQCINTGGEFSIREEQPQNIFSDLHGKMDQMILCRTQYEVAQVVQTLKELDIPVNREIGVFDSPEAKIIRAYAEVAAGNWWKWRTVRANPEQKITPMMKRMARRARFRHPLEIFMSDWRHTLSADALERYSKVINECGSSTINFVRLLKRKKFPKNNVRAMTLHASKGLESSHILLYNVNEGRMPHRWEDDIDAERRLLYVGMTRAKHRLTMMVNPDRKKSQFFEEIMR